MTTDRANQISYNSMQTIMRYKVMAEQTKCFPKDEDTVAYVISYGHFLAKPAHCELYL